MYRRPRAPALPQAPSWLFLALALLPIPARAAPTSSSDLARISVQPTEWFQDAFPFNETTGLPGTLAFDTTSALIVSGRNIAQTTGTLLRFDIPGDTIVATCAGSDVRMDLVFRIMPGVGNHVTVGSAVSGLRRVPTSTMPASSGDGSWWGTWLAMPGEFATPGAAALHAAWPGGWNPNVWMSARCDTAQMDLFPCGIAGVVAELNPARWMSTYHESDPHLAALGIPRRECFLIDTLGPAEAANITCSDVPAWVTADPSRAGYDGEPVTLEGTKIIPDGLLTPGAHVQYFWRASYASAPATMRRMCPDTTRVYPQPGEGSLDGHRWQQFGVLPDRWKYWTSGGYEPACMLVVDLADRRGDELVWVSTADSILLTKYPKYGAHNGWHGPGGADVNDPAYFKARHGGQAGTSWDLYQVKSGEDLTGHSGSLGGRLAYRDPSPQNLVDGKYARIAPTPEMLAAYYRRIVLLGGDLMSGALGPFADQSADDLELLASWLQGSTLSIPRGLVLFGSGLVEGLAGEPFLTDILGLDLYFGSYLELSTNDAAVPTLYPSTDVFPDGGRLLGVRDSPADHLDVLALNPALTEAAPMAWYAPVGASTFIGAVLKKANAQRPWIAATHGFRIGQLTSQWGTNTIGRLAYTYNLLNYPLHGDCMATHAICGVCDDDVPLDDPSPIDRSRVLGSPMVGGHATLEFALAAPDRVEIGIHDIGGRLVRALTARSWPAGVQRLTWDGRDDSGRRSKAGVYFARVRYAGRGFERTHKVIMLR